MCEKPALTRSAADGLGDSFGVASFFNLSPQAACHAVMSGSGSVGKAVVGKSVGNISPVSGFLKCQVLTACRTKGTCSSGASRIWIDSQRTNPFKVRAGTEGASKSFPVG